MPIHEEQVTLSYGADELFAVVADVKDYPLFVPWCSGARIHREDQSAIIADLVIGFGPFQESFTSHITLDPPRQVLVRAAEGPLEHLTNSWTFTPVADRTRVDFMIDFQFKKSFARSCCQHNVPRGRHADGECVRVLAFTWFI